MYDSLQGLVKTPYFRFHKVRIGSFRWVLRSLLTDPNVSLAGGLVQGMSVLAGTRQLYEPGMWSGDDGRGKEA